MPSGPSSSEILRRFWDLLFVSARTRSDVVTPYGPFKTRMGLPSRLRRVRIFAAVAAESSARGGASKTPYPAIGVSMLQYATLRWLGLFMPNKVRLRGFSACDPTFWGVTACTANEDGPAAFPNALKSEIVIGVAVGENCLFVNGDLWRSAPRRPIAGAGRCRKRRFSPCAILAYGLISLAKTSKGGAIE